MYNGDACEVSVPPAVARGPAKC